MTLTKDQIREAALQLDESDREALAEVLWQSISQADRDAIDAAWLDEARRRAAAYDRGESTASNVDDAIARVLARKPR